MFSHFFSSLVLRSHQKYQAIIRNCCEPNLENTIPSKIVCNLHQAAFYSAIDLIESSINEPGIMMNSMGSLRIKSQQRKKNFKVKVDST